MADGKSSIFCHVIPPLEHYDWIDITEALHRNKVIVCVLLLPWYVVEDLLERVVFSGLYNVKFITIELLPSFVEHIHRKHLKVTNLRSTGGMRLKSLPKQ